MNWLNGTRQTIEQDTAKWHEWRSRHIGASDVPIIMGVSPYKTAHQLWLEKTGQSEPFKGNWATERGKKIEPIAREMYNKKYTTNMVPEVAEHPEYKFLSASFDGIDHYVQRVIEIKFSGAVDHQGAINGHIPVKYIPQVQCQLLVSGYTHLDYVSYNDGDIAVVRVTPNPTIQAQIIEKTKEFWDMIQNKVSPVTIVERPELLELLAQRAKFKTEIDALTIGYEEVNSKIKELATSDCTVGPYHIKWTERKGNIDYGNIPQLKDLDLEPYRKEPTKFFSVKKEKM